MSTLPRLLSLLAVVALAATAGAERVYTYQFVPTTEGHFGFRGGLINARETAMVAGTFEVTEHDDGTTTLTHFAASVTPLPTDGEGFQTGTFATSSLLADLLFANPVGTPGVFDPESPGVAFLTQTPLDTALSPAALADSGDVPPAINLNDLGPQTRVVLSGLGESEIRVRIRSTPASLPDNPAFTTNAPGLIAVLVPEPATVALLGLLVLASPHGRRRA